MIIAVAPGSPAQIAGLLPGDQIMAIDSQPINEIKARTKNPALLGDAILDRIALVPSGQHLSLSIMRKGDVKMIAVSPVAICAGRTSVETRKGFDLRSDSVNVAIGIDSIAMMPSDDELALLLGHEYGHVFDRHAESHNVGAIRAQEVQADLMGAALAKCAGYDVSRGLQFWARYRKRPLGWLMADPTHGSIKARMERIASEAPAVQCPLAPYANGTLPADLIGYVP